jgi:serine protease Do
MLSRSSAVILSLTSMSAGVLLGIVLARGGPAVSAQVGGTARAVAKADDPAPAVPRTNEPTPVASKASTRARNHDDAVYDALGRRYKESFQQVDQTFGDVAKAVSPTVVHIVAQKAVKVEEGRRSRQFEETGSGVIVRSDRLPGLYVLTNHHVVENAKPAKIRIFLRDGRSLLPERVWSDGMADIAVMKLDRDDLSAARMGNSDDAAVGSWVMALGSPFGLTHSVSQGIISARSRHMEELEDVKNQDFLQTDAAINPGNSGGPLVNMKGEVVGINNSIASNGGGNEGVGFSIPINLARWIMNELIANGRVNRGALGVTLDDFSAEDAVKAGIERPRGARIREVFPSSAASRAGLRVGDVVLRFGGVEIADLNHLINTVSMSPIGQPAEVVVWREGREQTFRVTVAERDRTFPQLAEAGPDAEKDPTGLLRRPDRPGAASSYALGLELATLTPELAARVDLPERNWHGALIIQVEAASPFVELLRPRDVISSIDNQAIRSAEQAAAILSQRGEHGRLSISFDRPADGKFERRTIRMP